MICSTWDIVTISIENTPHTRPVIILSKPEFNQSEAHSLVAMITTDKRESWSTDTTIMHLETTGITAPAFVRMKLFTLPNEFIQKKIGALHPEDQLHVQQVLQSM